MSNKIQDLEQQILKAWSLKKDISTLTEAADWTTIDPVFMDRLLSIACVHEMHMEALWGLYEEVVNEYYIYKPRDVDFDWGDEASEKRQDIVGQNGPTAEHYNANAID
jgi:hypothetical protein